MRPAQIAATLPALFRARLPVYLSGPPGVGKTALVAQASATAGHHLIVSHPAVSESTDYKGLPWIADGRATFTAYDDLRALIDATEPTVFFLDDLPQAPVGVQAPIMQLLHARRVGEHRVADCVTFCAAGNRTQDRAGASRLISPLRSRLAAWIDVETDLTDWVGWALGNGVHEHVVGYACSTPTLFDALGTATDDAQVSPRTLVAASDILHLVLPDDVAAELLVGAIGKKDGALLTAYISGAARLPRPSAVYLSPTTTPVPTDPAGRHMLAQSLGATVTADTLPAALVYLTRFNSGENVVAFMRRATLVWGASPARRAAVDRLTSSPSFTLWASENSHVVF
jgi:hypothetical protein